MLSSGARSIGPDLWLSLGACVVLVVVLVEVLDEAGCSLSFST